MISRLRAAAVMDALAAEIRRRASVDVDQGAIANLEDGAAIHELAAAALREPTEAEIVAKIVAWIRKDMPPDGYAAALADQIAAAAYKEKP